MTIRITITVTPIPTPIAPGVITGTSPIAVHKRRDSSQRRMTIAASAHCVSIAPR